jgi:hypothetical protein
MKPSPKQQIILKTLADKDDAPDAEEYERLLTEDTEDLDEYPDCGLSRHARLRLLKGIILPTTVAMVEFIEHARPTRGN